MTANENLLSHKELTYILTSTYNILSLSDKSGIQAMGKEVSYGSY